MKKHLKYVASSYYQTDTSSLVKYGFNTYLICLWQMPGYSQFKQIYIPYIYNIYIHTHIYILIFLIALNTGEKLFRHSDENSSAGFLSPGKC